MYLRDRKPRNENFVCACLTDDRYLTVEGIQSMLDSGVRFLQISMSGSACSNTIEKRSKDIEISGEFDVVIMDKYNVIRGDLKSFLPAKKYVLSGTPDGCKSPWNFTAWDHEELNKECELAVPFDDYTEEWWYFNDQGNKWFGFPRKEGPAEKKRRRAEEQRKADLEAYGEFGSKVMTLMRNSSGSYKPGRFVVDYMDELPSDWNRYFKKHVYDYNLGCIVKCLQTSREYDGHSWDGLCLYAPCAPIHRREFESFFGFGGHCEGYREDKIVYAFPKYARGLDSKRFQEILCDEKNIMNRDTMEFLIWFLPNQGYMNDREAMYEYARAMAEIYGENISESQIKELIFPLLT